MSRQAAGRRSPRSIRRRPPSAKARCARSPRLPDLARWLSAPTKFSPGGGGGPSIFPDAAQGMSPSLRAKSQFA
jgi:hypothetical protein